MRDFSFNSPIDCEFSNFSDVSDSKILTATLLLEAGVVSNFSSRQLNVLDQPQFSDISDYELVLVSQSAEAHAKPTAECDSMSSDTLSNFQEEKCSKNKLEFSDISGDEFVLESISAEAHGSVSTKVS
jgi:hypothetical protein